MGAKHLLVTAVLVACNGDGTGTDTTSGTTDLGSSDAPTGTHGETGTGTGTTEPVIRDLPPPDPLAGYQSCAEGCPEGQCITLEGADICGPACTHFSPHDCRSSSPLPALCPHDLSGVPAICILGCTTAADCPAPEMVCLPCPEPFTYACQYLNNFIGYEGSTSMCAWPTP